MQVEFGQLCILNLENNSENIFSFKNEQNVYDLCIWLSWKGKLNSDFKVLVKYFSIDNNEFSYEYIIYNDRIPIKLLMDLLDCKINKLSIAIDSIDNLEFSVKFEKIDIKEHYKRACNLTDEQVELILQHQKPFS